MRKIFRLLKQYKMISIILFLYIVVLFVIAPWIYKIEYENDNLRFSEYNEQLGIRNKAYFNLQKLGDEYNYREKDIYQIIKMGDFDLSPVYHGESLSSNESEYNFITERKIGAGWGQLYKNYYVDNGYTHYSIEFYKDEEIKYVNPIDDNVKRQYFTRESATQKHYTVKLYKLEPNGNYHDSSEVEHEKVLELYVDETIKPMEKDCNVVPIDTGFAVILGDGYSLPNDAYFRMHDFQYNKEATFDYTDYLYFSTVAITTFGFGDIVPGSGLARCIVIIEVLMGVFLLGTLTAIISNYITAVIKKRKQGEYGVKKCSELVDLVNIYKSNKDVEQRFSKTIDYISKLGDKRLKAVMDCKSNVAFNTSMYDFLTVLTFLFTIAGAVTGIMKSVLIMWILYVGILVSVIIIINMLVKRTTYEYILTALEGVDSLKDTGKVEIDIEEESGEKVHTQLPGARED